VKPSSLIDRVSFARKPQSRGIGVITPTLLKDHIPNVEGEFPAARLDGKSLIPPPRPSQTCNWVSAISS
jgi:hypothetical protein